MGSAHYLDDLAGLISSPGSVWVLPAVVEHILLPSRAAIQFQSGLQRHAQMSNPIEFRMMPMPADQAMPDAPCR
jgi:hypothetical protein